jgi:hypothetical protein
VDGFRDGIVYQFHGDFVHGRDNRFPTDAPHPMKRNGMTFAQVYADTMARDQAIIDAGYKLVLMWESEWKDQRVAALGLPVPAEPRVIPDGMGYCSRCQSIKPRSSFALARKRPSGLQGWCKVCTRTSRSGPNLSR